MYLIQGYPSVTGLEAGDTADKFPCSHVAGNIKNVLSLKNKIWKKGEEDNEG